MTSTGRLSIPVGWSLGMRCILGRPMFTDRTRDMLRRLRLCVATWATGPPGRAYGASMPLLRIEIEATDRTEARRVLSLYATGDRLPSLDGEVVDEAWALGR